MKKEYKYYIAFISQLIAISNGQSTGSTYVYLEHKINTELGVIEALGKLQEKNIKLDWGYRTEAFIIINQIEITDW